jgi:hypothetical protein
MRTIDRTDKAETPKCNYCGTTTPEHGFATKDVIHRGSNPYTGKAEVVKSKFTVCKDTPCGGNLQMAYEG